MQKINKKRRLRKRTGEDQTKIVIPKSHRQIYRKSFSVVLTSEFPQKEFNRSRRPTILSVPKAASSHRKARAGLKIHISRRGFVIFPRQVQV